MMMSWEIYTIKTIIASPHTTHGGVYERLPILVSLAMGSGKSRCHFPVAVAAQIFIVGQEMVRVKLAPFSFL